MNDLAESMGVHRKTIIRWADLLDALHGREPGSERVVRERGDDGRAWLRLEHPGETGKRFTPYQAASALLAVQGLAGGGGSLLSDCADDMLSGVEEAERLRQSFYAHAHDPRSYRVHEDTLDLILRAVVQRRRISFTRRGVATEEPRWFEPWTLVAYNGAFYLYGLDARRGETRTWAVERMDDVVLTEARFEVPVDYDPGAVFRDRFGIFTGPWAAEEVVVRFSEQVWNAVTARSLAGTVRLDASTRTMTWKIAITPEVVTWLVGWAAEAEVLAPAHLRGKVAEAHRAAAALYVVTPA